MLRRLRLSLGRAGTTASSTTSSSTSSTKGGPAPKKPMSSTEATRKLWSPLGARATSTPRQVISGSEMSTMLYRRLPPERTVESEEDFGNTLMIHREFVSQKSATEGSIQWDLNPEARSGIEQRRAKASIAQGVNEARKQVARNENEQYIPHLQVSNFIDATPGSIESVRYIFDEPRMKYCDRFQRFYNSATNDDENNNNSSSTTIQIDLASECKALLETCAILYGCDSDEGRESWYNFFLQLDRESLETLEERRMNQQEILDNLAEDEEDEIDLSENEQKQIAENSDNKKSSKLKEVPAEFADIYASYQAYCKGQSPTFGNATLVESNADISETSILRKFKYRKLLELLVEEKPLSEYPDGGEINAVEVAIELDNQLQALKLYGLRVGESVKEALMLQDTRGPGSPGVSMMDRPIDMSPYNPDRVELGHRQMGTTTSV